MKKLSFSHRFLFVAAAALVTVCGTGCGNWMQGGVHQAAPSSYKTPGINYTDVTGNGGFPNDTSYTCQSHPTILTAGGADPYTICMGQTGFDISIHGNPTRGKSQVCVFPVDVLSSTQAYAASDTNGQVLEQCIDMSSDYSTLTFSGARFNGVFVVESADAANMAWCLQNGNYEVCPAYSYQRWGAYDTGITGNAGH